MSLVNLNEMLAEAVFQCDEKNGFSTERVACIGDSITFGSAVKGAGTNEGECYPAVLRTLLRMRDVSKTK